MFFNHIFAPFRISPADENQATKTKFNIKQISKIFMCDNGWHFRQNGFSLTQLYQDHLVCLPNFNIDTYSHNSYFGHTTC